MVRGGPIPIHNGQSPTPNQIGRQLHDSHVYNQMEAAKGTGKMRRTFVARYCKDCAARMSADEMDRYTTRCRVCHQTFWGNS